MELASCVIPPSSRPSYADYDVVSVEKYQDRQRQVLNVPADLILPNWSFMMGFDCRPYTESELRVKAWKTKNRQKKKARKRARKHED